jgi:molecular chaperone IbpA
MNISELEKLFIGFDRLPTWPTTTEYPRYNIVRGEEGYQIQVACPGWNRDQIQVTFREDNNTLTICGKKNDEHKDISWVHKGISGKSFQRNFKLDTNLEACSADMENGLLVIDIVHSKNSGVKTIPIGQAPDLDGDCQNDKLSVG